MRNIAKYLSHNFTDLGTVHVIRKPTERAEHVLEIRAYIKKSIKPKRGLRATDIHRKVCDIYKEDQMSFSTVYRWVAKLKSGLQHRKIFKKNLQYAKKMPDLAWFTNMLLSQVHDILKKHLKL